MTKIQLTWAQADVVEAAITKHFDIKTFAALGDEMATNNTHSTIQGFFCIANQIVIKKTTGKGLNLLNKPGVALVAVELFGLLSLNAFSEQEMDTIINCGIMKVVKGVAKN